MDRKLIEFLVKLRDAHTMAAEATNEYIETLTPQEIKDDKPAVLELNFSALKFEAQQSSKLGSFEVAHKTGNIAEKWASAFNILNSSNATIQNRYYGKGYDFSYWLYGADKIYRQKLKQGANMR